MPPRLPPDPHPHPSTEGYPSNTLTPFWGPPCCSAIPRKDCRGVLQPARNMAFQRTLQSSEVTAPKTQGGGWSLGGGRIARPHHTPRHLHLKVIEDSKGQGQGQDHHKHSWNKSRPGAQEKLPKVFWGVHVYVFSFRCIHVIKSRDCFLILVPRNSSQIILLKLDFTNSVKSP